MKTKSTAQSYTAVYEPAGEAGWWTVTIAEVPGCISQGRGIAQARARIQEALGLMVDDADAATLTSEFRLGREVQRAVSAHRKRRADADRLAAEASASTRAAVRALMDAGLSTRDAGEALGVSQARIAQIAARLAEDEPVERAKRTKAARRAAG